MSIKPRQITVSGLRVQVVRKGIKNLHLGVYPPSGRVRVAVPLRVNDGAVRLAVISKLGWIKRQLARFEAQPRQSRREMVSGESHFFLGRRYRLRVIENAASNKVTTKGRFIELHLYSDVSQKKRADVLNRWYRQQLKLRIAPMLTKWQSVLGVEVSTWGIKRMKTRWGTCNAEARRIWLNLELAKKPIQCLEYILVHELTHLLERSHNERFVSLMNQHLPSWRIYREQLNAEPLAYSKWSY